MANVGLLLIFHRENRIERYHLSAVHYHPPALLQDPVRRKCRTDHLAQTELFQEGS